MQNGDYIDLDAISVWSSQKCLLGWCGPMRTAHSKKDLKLDQKLFVCLAKKRVLKPEGKK